VVVSQRGIFRQRTSLTATVSTKATTSAVHACGPLIGQTWDQAKLTLGRKGLVGVAPDSPALVESGWTVTDQSPESGARVPAGSMVTLWVERGGGSGVREPRRPGPTSGVGRATRPDPSTEAVS